jgi:methylthioxylose transferase
VVWLRAGPRRAVEVAGLCALALGVFYAALALLFGFDPIGALQATSEVYRLGVASMRPYAFWVFGSPVAFLLVLGLPIAWLAARALGRGDRLAIAIWTVLAASAVLGFTKAETERIWLFFAPYVCLAAAPLVTRRGLRPLLAVLAAQALLAEALFGTPW